MNFRQQSILCPHPGGTHRMMYTDWGREDNPFVLICAHGLTRNGRDFDYLAQAMSAKYRVICPDIVGRGGSDWLPTASDYQYSTYIKDMLYLIEKLQLKNITWLGTSMGGILGMQLAAQHPDCIQRLIINDVGAKIPKLALQRIYNYLHSSGRAFNSLSAIETHLRHIHAGFGDLLDQQWRQLAINSHYVVDGVYYLAYDPQIRDNFANYIQQDIELWEVWQAIKAPILAIHGSDSDVLTAEILLQMKQLQPKLNIIHCIRIAHAPSLMEVNQVNAIKNWLAEN
jgi:pimeloyl-ACP methyl ester carboxylesterase